ncbi:MAG: hypothetical protein LQ350_006653 [Teloschistes chrysophthalmus]|nr:MAG: hypothetical protein LQ350_006653 [Niorma chrysophthalma]
MSPSHRFNCEAYKISKTALNHLTVEWANQLAEHGSGQKRTAAGQSEAGSNEEGWSVVAFSPGWLRTSLGGPYVEHDVEYGAKAVVEFVGRMGVQENGKFIMDDGTSPPW